MTRKINSKPQNSATRNPHTRVHTSAPRAGRIPKKTKTIEIYPHKTVIQGARHLISLIMQRIQLNPGCSFIGNLLHVELGIVSRSKRKKAIIQVIPKTDLTVQRYTAAPKGKKVSLAKIEVNKNIYPFNTKGIIHLLNVEFRATEHGVLIISATSNTIYEPLQSVA